MLAPITREKLMGKAEVRQVFTIPKAGTIAGCFVTEGKITRKAQLRLVRDSVVIYTGKVGSLRRFKDDVSRGRAGLRVRPRRSRATATSRKATSSRPSRSRRSRRRSRTRPASREAATSAAADCERRSPVTVGIARVTLFLGDSHSLKDKRMVLRKVKDLVRNKFNVSIAEVSENDAGSGRCWASRVVGSDRRFAESALDEVLRFIRGQVAGLERGEGAAVVRRRAGRPRLQALGGVTVSQRLERVAGEVRAIAGRGRWRATRSRTRACAAPG